ncbi:MAG: FMN-binding protein [Emergencia sp.]|nr:FMN-binding protein [Emergencia sp.]
MKNNNTFKEYVAPIVVLVAICLVITAALAATYGVTQPIIEENSIKAANETRAKLIEADSFTEFDGELAVAEKDKVFATDCYIADNGAGMVVTVSTKSFGGALTEMIGIDADGKITGIEVTAHADTPGLGTKAHDPAYLEQYKGKGTDEITTTSAKDEAAINHITGATISSNAVHYGVYCAMEQYKIVGGAK